MLYNNIELLEELQKTNYLNNANDDCKINFLLKQIKIIKNIASQNLLNWTEIYNINKNNDNFYNKMISDICITNINEQLDLANNLELDVLNLKNNNDKSIDYFIDNHIIHRIEYINFITAQISIELLSTDRLISQFDRKFQHIQLLMSHKNNIYF